MGGRPWTRREDDTLLAASGRVPIERLAARLGRTAAAVVNRAGLLRAGRAPRTYADASGPRGGRTWTAGETRYLHATVGLLSPEEIARELRRTPVAVRLRAKRLGLHWVQPLPGTPVRHGYPASEVARMLGVRDAKMVVGWITAGYLDGHRSGVRVGRHRVWRVYPEAIERFLRTYRWLYDARRVTDPACRALVRALPPEGYVGTAEAARLLCYQPASVVKLIARGDLAADKHGASWRIPMSAIARFRRPADLPHPGRRVPDDLRAHRERTLARRARLTAERTERRAAA